MQRRPVSVLASAVLLLGAVSVNSVRSAAAAGLPGAAATLSDSGWLQRAVAGRDAGGGGCRADTFGELLRAAAVVGASRIFELGAEVPSERHFGDDDGDLLLRALSEQLSPLGGVGGEEEPPSEIPRRSTSGEDDDSAAEGDPLQTISEPLSDDEGDNTGEETEARATAAEKRSAVAAARGAGRRRRRRGPPPTLGIVADALDSVGELMGGLRHDLRSSHQHTQPRTAPLLLDVTRGGGGGGGGGGVRQLHALRPLRRAEPRLRTFVEAHRRRAAPSAAANHDPGLLWVGLGR